MAISYKALINVRKEPNKSGKYSILIRVSLNRKSVYLNTGEKIVLLVITQGVKKTGLEEVFFSQTAFISGHKMSLFFYYLSTDKFHAI